MIFVVKIAVVLVASAHRSACLCAPSLKLWSVGDRSGSAQVGSGALAFAEAMRKQAGAAMLFYMRGILKIPSNRHEKYCFSEGRFF